MLSFLQNFSPEMTIGGGPNIGSVASTRPMPSGGPNVGQVMPQQPMGMPAMTSGGPSQRPMVMPSGGPNVGRPIPQLGGDNPLQIDAGGPMQPPPMDVATAIACGIPPSQVTNLGGNPVGSPPLTPISSFMDIFNRPPSGMGGMPQPQVSQMPSFGAPSTPKSVDQGLGMQQMNYGNPMGGMNNWFSNFTAPQPMPAPAPSSPAPMMPMKGMFGVR